MFVLGLYTDHMILYHACKHTTSTCMHHTHTHTRTYTIHITPANTHTMYTNTQVNTGSRTLHTEDIYTIHYIRTNMHTHTHTLRTGTHRVT